MAHPSLRILANAGELVPNNGISIQTLQVNEELARRGHRIDLLYIADGPQTPDYECFCEGMRRVPRLDLDFDLRSALRFGPRLLPAVRAGARDRPDVIYVNRYRPLA